MSLKNRPGPSEAATPVSPAPQGPMRLLHETDNRPVADPDHLSAPSGGLCAPRRCFSPFPTATAVQLENRGNHRQKSNWGRVYLRCRWPLCHANRRITKPQIQLLGMSLLLNSAFLHCARSGLVVMVKHLTKSDFFFSE